MNYFRFIKLGFLRLKSPEDYRSMQEFIVCSTLDELSKRGIHISNSSVLELGAGRGGYSEILFKKVRSFIASDLIKDNFFLSSPIPFQNVDVIKEFPFKENLFDLIYCSSVIEHVSHPLNLLAESKRILKPGGILYLTFPPFYSLSMVGGHQFKPFHFLGEKTAIRFTNIFKPRYKADDYKTCGGAFGLFPLKIDDVKNMILQTGFKLKETYTRMFPINTSRLPGLLKDLFTWHVCFIAQKPV